MKGRVLIANRGEIACRVTRACHAVGLESIAIFAPQDANALHVKIANSSVALPGSGVSAYLDRDAVLSAAKNSGATLVHPGYGFLAEDPVFAQMVSDAGLVWVGPSSKTITLFGDKVQARNLAQKCGVPVLAGSETLTSPAEIRNFMKQSNVPFPVILKAQHGGGGRGQRIIFEDKNLDDGFKQCTSEAEMSFGQGAVFVEQFVTRARHVEVQVLGDGTGNVSHLYERDCSVQLRNQKMVEIAPCRGMHPQLRERMVNCAVSLSKEINYKNAGTLEFLVIGGDVSKPDTQFVFLEMNPRIQVEHTITEMITGVDLVASQLKIALGDTLQSLNLTQEKIPPISGCAVQLRITLLPSKSLELKNYQEPVGPGIRVDTGIYKGATLSTEFDPLLAKLIIWEESGDFGKCVDRSVKSLHDFVIDGPMTNKHWVERILLHNEMRDNTICTCFMADHGGQILAPPGAVKKSKPKKAKVKKAAGPAKKIPAVSPFPGQITEVKVKNGDSVNQGDVLCILSAMKMFNDIISPCTGKVVEVNVQANQQVEDSVNLVVVEGVIEEADDSDHEEIEHKTLEGFSNNSGGGMEHNVEYSMWYPNKDVRPSTKPDTLRLRSSIDKNSAQFKKRYEVNLKLAEELNERLKLVKKGGGDKYVKRLEKQGKFMARTRVEKIIDKGTYFMELCELAAWGMYDGKVHSAGYCMGIGLVHGRETMIVANDVTVKGGAQYKEGFCKTLRAQEIAIQNNLPIIYLVESGGAMLMPKTEQEATHLTVGFVWGGIVFRKQAQISAMKIPQVGCVLGSCTAGGAYIPAMCDEVIVVNNQGRVYLAGPPLVKAATGEDCNEEDLGGGAMHCSKSGVLDHLALNEEEALQKTRIAMEHIGRYTPRAILERRAPEEPAYSPDEILGVIPESNSIPYDVREVIARIVDGSRFHEFKPKYGPTLVCGWAHLYGYPVGIVANNGMLFVESSLKAAHFVNICGHRRIPLIFMHNITGFIVGTEYEQQGITKAGAKMITAVSCVPVPKFTIILGGSHGAGNYAMCGKAFNPRFTFLWPNARICVMGGEQAGGVLAQVKQNQRNYHFGRPDSNRETAVPGQIISSVPLLLAIPFGVRNKKRREGKKPLTAEQENEMKQPVIDMYNQYNDCYNSTANLFDEGIIDPRSTRAVLGRCISVSLNAKWPTGEYGVFQNETIDTEISSHPYQVQGGNSFLASPFFSFISLVLIVN